MATEDESPLKISTEKIKINTRNVFKIGKYVGMELFELNMYVLKYFPFPVSKLIFFLSQRKIMAESDETKKLDLLSEAMRSFRQSLFVRCVDHLYVKFRLSLT